MVGTILLLTWFA